jgi:VanZ family protein
MFRSVDCTYGHSGWPHRGRMRRASNRGDETITINPQTVAVSPRSRPCALYWAMAVGWAALIFYLSTSKFAPHFSESLVARALTFLHIGLPPRIVHVLDSALRKSAHLFEYGMFSLLLYASLPNEDSPRSRLRRALWCVLIAAAYSLTDEFHQVFVPGRHASLRDCGVDVAGAGIAAAIAYQGQRWFRGISLGYEDVSRSRNGCRSQVAQSGGRSVH